MPAADKEALTIEPWAAWIGLAILAVVAGVALFTLWDRAHTVTLEVVLQPTAVGDTHCVPAPPGGKGPIGLTYQGRKLDMLSESKIRDSKLLRAAVDDSGLYILYRPGDDQEALPKDRFLVKVKTDDFMVVTPE